MNKKAQIKELVAKGISLSLATLLVTGSLALASCNDTPTNSNASSSITEPASPSESTNNNIKDPVESTNKPAESTNQGTETTPEDTLMEPTFTDEEKEYIQSVLNKLTKNDERYLEGIGAIALILSGDEFSLSISLNGTRGFAINHWFGNINSDLALQIFNTSKDIVPTRITSSGKRYYIYLDEGTYNGQNPIKIYELLNEILETIKNNNMDNENNPS